ncbi:MULTISPECIES: ribbon-helix-helix domain-containing protein [Oscillatoriales]|uniref:Transcriptional regulator, CopG-like n=4 Tax=Limnospira TaxID=2596745 RepID=A0A9P1KIW3_9CYAN|nr:MULTISPECIES: ribbon-helix-helix domain-containing protein [Oscillatoriales]EKD08304.1 CopG domain protein DNA-binding domain protein [Arthrospira platensis C1]KDR56740.1 CopG family transcriptional regulator [Arthrospira platensis str. Paraca]MBD2671592.1 ribbon-helix-helix protein, CopG family [Arthrospira platensis FACHB-439]MBD2712521.1 ribbon-helix-helix protein, CopG family [Arthrospira platensis FACHB-835]MDC0840048.1 ribbon-helix-helix domain-containing protein [Limnoraphis robusta]
MTATVPSNKPKLQVYLDEQMLEEGKKLAEKRQRSLSSLIRRLLQLEIEEAKNKGEI